MTTNFRCGCAASSSRQVRAPKSQKIQERQHPRKRCEESESWQVSRKLSFVAFHGLERSKVSVGCCDVHFRHAPVGPSLAFQGRELLKRPTVAWNPACLVRQFGSATACHMRSKTPQVWSVRVYARFEACLDRVSDCKSRCIDRRRSQRRQSLVLSIRHHRILPPLLNRSFNITTTLRQAIRLTCKSSPIATSKHLLRRYLAVRPASRDRAVLRRSKTVHFLVDRRPYWRFLCARALSREAGFSTPHLTDSSPNSPQLNDRNPQNWGHCPIANQGPVQ